MVCAGNCVTAIQELKASQKMGVFLSFSASAPHLPQQVHDPHAVVAAQVAQLVPEVEAAHPKPGEKHQRWPLRTRCLIVDMPPVAPLPGVALYLAFLLNSLRRCLTLRWSTFQARASCMYGPALRVGILWAIGQHWPPQTKQQLGSLSSWEM